LSDYSREELFGKDGIFYDIWKNDWNDITEETDAEDD
jgi:hypothetical protein